MNTVKCLACGEDHLDGGHLPCPRYSTNWNEYSSDREFDIYSHEEFTRLYMGVFKHSEEELSKVVAVPEGVDTEEGFVKWVKG